jgi:hypothetical protein
MKWILPLLFLLSCTQSAKSPEELLNSFLEERQKGPLNRAFVLEHTTGTLNESFMSIPAEQFPLVVFGGNPENGKIKILRKNCNGDKCVLTYIVSFKTKLESSSYSTSVKKVAEIVKEDGEWLLSDVFNTKTYHETESAIKVESN